MPLISFLNLTLALSGLVILGATLVLIVDYVIFKGRYLSHLMSRVSWPLLIGLTTGSVITSLVYSEYFNFVPCSLCWLQRIAIYPQALLTLMAFTVKDSTNFPRYGIGLSVFGLLVAIYQYIYQMLPEAVRNSGVAPCLVDGSGADCATKVIDMFGFVTLPFISAATFAFLIMTYLYLLRQRASDPTHN